MKPPPLYIAQMSLLFLALKNPEIMAQIAYTIRVEETAVKLAAVLGGNPDHYVDLARKYDRPLVFLEMWLYHALKGEPFDA
jgi:hypothetical protein